MKKWVSITIVIALLGGGYFVFNYFQGTQEANASSDRIEIVTIDEGSLVSIIDATGVVRSKQSTTLRWETSGTVEAVNVEIGTLVESGEELASLAQISLPQNVIMAQADLVNAKIALDELYTSAEDATTMAMKDIAQYAQDERDAQYQLDNYTVPSNQADLGTMEALDLMAERLEEARQAFEPYKYFSSGNTTRQELKEALDEAQSDYNSAVKRLDYEYEVHVAQDNLEKARQDYDEWIDGPEPDDILAAEARIAAAEATLSQAWIEAPFAGTVTSIDAQVGAQVSANTEAFRIDDLSILFVDLEVSEIDISQIEIGQQVSVTFDALRGKNYNGEVVEIAAIGAESQGVVNFTVTVELSDPDSDVRPGMTSSVEIVVSKNDHALLVPNQALKYEDGVQVVYVVGSGGEMLPVEVKLGASSDTYSEVLFGDLQAGDQILLNPFVLDAPTEESRMPLGNGGSDEARPGFLGRNGGQ
jgi:HlyD family secretion protein